MLITQPEKFSDMVLDSILQLTFKKSQLVEFECILKNIHNYANKKAIKILIFATMYLCEAGSSSYTSTKTTYHYRLNAEADMRIQLSSINPDIKKSHRILKQCYSSH